jgi:hypothetical protein
VAHHRLYDCRHTAASFLLAQGVAPRVATEVLGHSSLALTMDTYTHVLPTIMRDADAMDRALENAQGARRRNSGTQPGGQLAWIYAQKIGSDLGASGEAEPEAAPLPPRHGEVELAVPGL